MPGAVNHGSARLADGEEKVIAHRILSREPMVPRSGDAVGLINGQKFNLLLADAKKLARAVLEREGAEVSGG
jgi:hypothetical protein